MDNHLTEESVSEDFFLRRWKIEDAAWYVNARDEEIFRWTKEKRDLTIQETVEAIIRVNTSSNALCFAIVDRHTLALLGNLALVLDETNPKTAEIMYWLAPSARGRGIATKAVLLVCNKAFNSMGCCRITLKILRGNIRSQQVAERAGFHMVPDAPDIKMNEDLLWFEKSKIQ